jgi:hypothetical protein
MRNLLVVVVFAVLGGVGALGVVSAGSSEAAPPVRGSVPATSRVPC